MITPGWSDGKGDGVMIDQDIIDGGMGVSTVHARPLAALRGPIAKGGASPLLLIGPRGDWSDMASLADVRLAGIAPPSGAADAIRRMPKLDKIGRAHVSTPVTNAQLVCHLLLETKKNT